MKPRLIEVGLDVLMASGLLIVALCVIRSEGSTTTYKRRVLIFIAAILYIVALARGLDWIDFT